MATPSSYYLGQNHWSPPRFLPTMPLTKLISKTYCIWPLLTIHFAILSQTISFLIQVSKTFLTGALPSTFAFLQLLYASSQSNSFHMQLRSCHSSAQNLPFLSQIKARVLQWCDLIITLKSLPPPDSLISSLISFYLPHLHQKTSLMSLLFFEQDKQDSASVSLHISRKLFLQREGKSPS